MSTEQTPEIRPHMSAGELSMFRRALDIANVYLEFGAGGSTIEAVSRQHLQCYCVEADESWLSALQCRSEIKNAIDDGRLSLTHADIGPVGAWSFPLKRDGDLRWDNYCLAVWRQLPQPPDLVLVDGRFRLACCIISFLASPAKTKVLLHDFGRDKPHRQSYELATELGNVVDSSGTLLMLQRKPDFDHLKAMSLLEVARKDVW